MFATKKRLNGARIVALSAMGLSAGLLTSHAQAVTSYYFDVNGSTSGLGTLTSGSTFDWDDTSTGGLWNTSSTGTGTNSAWFGTALQGQFPRFTVGAAGETYTITVSNDESMAGLYMTTAGTLTLSQAPSTSGDLNITTGYQGFIGTSGGSLYITAPITGVGGVAPESTGSNLYLFGNNTYSGGTQLGDSGAPLTYFNNNNSFGTGPMQLNGSATSFAAILSTGGTSATPLTITLPNNWIAPTNSGAGVNFANGSYTPVVTTGTWTLGANSINIRNNSDATAPVTISGAIGGTGGVVFSGANGGTINLSTVNGYSGTTTVGAPSDTNFILNLAAANTIASSSKVILAGGTLNPGGLNQSMTATTLGMTATSTIDFGGVASEVDFANSNAVAWTGTLNLANWNPAVDELRFGTDSTGLTTAQLADIEFNGAGAGTASLNANGYVTVPEPASLSLLALAAMPLLRRRRA